MVMEEQQSDMELDSERVPVPRVQKSMENSQIETVNKTTSISQRKPRLRKKALHAAILKQMEFYFSNANLSKDRFLSSLIKEDPYVDLSVFIRFNKIRELTTDINRINKALQASEILSLSEDGTKVRRVTPIVLKENVDECTVYVQNLPPDTDHEMLSSIFSQYGSVDYASVPRYKHNKKIKGFAFVEFDTLESAKKCLKAFQKKGCVLPSHTAPDELLSITTFDDAEKDVTLMGRQNKSNPQKAQKRKADDQEVDEPDEDTRLQNREEEEVQQDKVKIKTEKRKRSDSEPTETIATGNRVDTEIVKTKKSKYSVDVSTSEAEQINIREENAPRKVKREKSVSMNEEVLDNGIKNEEMATEESAMMSTEEEENANEKKKKRKRKRRSKTEDASYNLGLQVMAKRDWKHLRNKYLELQRSKMKQLKQHLRKTKWNQWPNYERMKTDKEENDEKEKTCKQDSDSKVTPRFSFTPGVIVKIEMDKPCTDPKGLKMELKVNNAVKYIDVKESSFFAYVRCDSADAAQALAQKSNEERHMTILEGEEEQVYWDKISKDREEKLGNKIRPKQRGRNKLLKKAEKVLGKHIKFDEV